MKKINKKNPLVVVLAVFISLFVVAGIWDLITEHKQNNKRDEIAAGYSTVKLPVYITIQSTSRGGDGLDSALDVDYVYNSSKDFNTTYNEIRADLLQQGFIETDTLKVSDAIHSESSFVNTNKQLNLHVSVTNSGRVNIDATKDVEL